MGVVYLALAGAADRERLCVVKMLHADGPSGQGGLERFRRETEIVRKLSHGAIAQTMAIDEVDGALCIVQEHIHGRNLTQIVSAVRSVAPGRIPVFVCLHIVREVARALAYAHHAGIVHRDVAPPNVMVAFSGEVKLIDFGVARLADTTESSVTLTRPGEFLGRMVYTAPEVLDGARADRRADVYSAGVLLWELLTGQLPLFGESHSRRAPPLPSSYLPEVPREVDAAVLKALAPDPADRFDTAEDLQRALGSCLPASFAGEPELRGFMARCYDVAAERRRLHDEVAAARCLVSDGGENSDLQPSDSPAGFRSRSWRARVALAVGVAGTAVGASLLVRAIPTVSPPPAARELPPARASLEASTSTGTMPPPAVRNAPETGTPAQPRTASGRMASTPVRRAAKASTSGPSAGILLDRALDSLQAGDVDLADRNARGVLEGGATPLEKAGAHVILGKIFVLKSKPRDAAAEFSAAIELDPANEAATAALARLRRRGQL